MTRNLVSALQTREAKGMSVMGMDVTNGEYIFSGNVLDVIESGDEKPNMLLVEGVMFDGNRGIPFKQNMPIEMLKIFDKGVFEEAYKMMESSEIAISNAIYFKERCKQLMT